jgi:S1-C subfamily serine protease
MSVKVQRGTRTLSFSIMPTDMEQPSERLADLAGISKSQVPQLGIMAVTFDERTSSIMGPVRLASGAIAIARIAAAPDAAGADLRPGDLIHEINGKNVFSVDDLKNVIADLKHGDAVALFIERAQQWSYVAFTLP